MKIRLTLFVLFLFLGIALYSIGSQSLDPIIKTNLAIQTVNGGNEVLTTFRSYNSMNPLLTLFSSLAYIYFLYILFPTKEITQYLKNSK